MSGTPGDVQMCLMRPEIIVWQLNESHMSDFGFFGRMPTGNFLAGPSPISTQQT